MKKQRDQGSAHRDGRGASGPREKARRARASDRDCPALARPGRKSKSRSAQPHAPAGWAWRSCHRNRRVAHLAMRSAGLGPKAPPESGWALFRPGPARIVAGVRRGRLFRRSSKGRRPLSQSTPASLQQDGAGNNRTRPGTPRSARGVRSEQNSDVAELAILLRATRWKIAAPRPSLPSQDGVQGHVSK